MQGGKKERWMELAEQVANEQDPQKFNELVQELNRLLAEKDNRLHPEPKEESSKQLYETRWNDGKTYGAS
jgi:hypothetical protein